MDYIEIFKNLKPNAKYSRKSPQKAILLLSIIDMYENKVLSDNEIKYDETLKNTYIKIWKKTLPNNNELFLEAYQPFWYMQSEDFWHVVPIHGKEDILTLLQDNHIKPSEVKLKECVQYVELDDDLYFMMTMTSSRSHLKRALLETYSALSTRMIDKLSLSPDNSIDNSVIAMDKYQEMLVPSEVKHTVPSIVTNNNLHQIFSQLDEDIQIIFNFEYYKFLKSHRHEREMFKEICPTVEYLYGLITQTPIKADELSPSFSFLYENFLCDLKIALLTEDSSTTIIDKINEALYILTSDVSSLDSLSTESNNETYAQVYEVSNEEIKNSSILKENGSHKEKFCSSIEESRLSSQSQLNHPIENESQALDRTTNSMITCLPNLGLMNDVYEKEQVSEKTPVLSSNNASIEFFVENSSNQGSIFNMQGERIFTISGQIKVIHRKLYRFNYKDNCFTVKDLVKDGNMWIRGLKKIVAYSSSELYQSLKEKELLNQIQDIIEYQNWEKNQILVDGKWYDYQGFYLRDSDITATISELSETKLPNELSFRTNYVPKGKLKSIDKVAQNSYDYLWLIAITDFMGNKQPSPLLSYDDLACMMIANAWELFHKHPELMKHELALTECIEYLIAESKTNMEEQLSWCSPRDVVFYSIKDYPMAGVFEDVVEELVKSAPYNILKAWISSSDYHEIVAQSNTFDKACLYAIHPRRIDPYIEINPGWFRSLCHEHDNLIDYFQKHYITYLNSLA